jgi:hypothetical protein
MKNWWCRNFYNRVNPFAELQLRRLGEFPAVCDICNKKLNFSDYGYMCKEHAVVYYHTFWRFLPKFMFRVFKKVVR